MAGDPGFWDVAWNWPLPFVTVVAMLAVPMAGIIWFVCRLRYKHQIATLKDRVELADERLGDAKEKIVKAEEGKTALHTTVKELNAQIEKLKKRKAQLPRELPFDDEVALTVAPFYLIHMLQRTVPAGFIARCLPTTR